MTGESILKSADKDVSVQLLPEEKVICKGDIAYISCHTTCAFLHDISGFPIISMTPAPPKSHGNGLLKGSPKAIAYDMSGKVTGESILKSADKDVSVQLLPEEKDSL